MDASQMDAVIPGHSHDYFVTFKEIVPKTKCPTTMWMCLRKKHPGHLTLGWLETRVISACLKVAPFKKKRQTKSVVSNLIEA